MKTVLQIIMSIIAVPYNQCQCRMSYNQWHPSSYTHQYTKYTPLLYQYVNILCTIMSKWKCQKLWIKCTPANVVIQLKYRICSFVPILSKSIQESQSELRSPFLVILRSMSKVPSAAIDILYRCTSFNFWPYIIFLYLICSHVIFLMYTVTYLEHWNKNLSLHNTCTKISKNKTRMATCWGVWDILHLKYLEDIPIYIDAAESSYLWVVPTVCLVWL